MIQAAGNDTIARLEAGRVDTIEYSDDNSDSYSYTGQGSHRVRRSR